MRYLGNKNRIANKLKPSIIKHLLHPGISYIEPFCGALGMLSNINHPNRIGYDNNLYIIALMQAIQRGYEPPTEISEDFYQRIKANPEYYSPKLVGFVGFGCSYGGKWFGGLARSKDAKGHDRNMAKESARNLQQLRPRILGIELECRSFTTVYPDLGSVVYCDPPYENTTKYSSEFDFEKFWNWVRRCSETSYVYVSSYEAPADFEVLLSLDHKTGIDKGLKTHSPRTEKLFTWRGGRI